MTTKMKAHKTMKTTKMLVIGFLLAALPTGVAIVSAAAPETPLTEAGQKLEARYAEQLKALQAEIAREVPAVGEAKKAAYLAAREAVSKAETAVNAAQQPLAKIPQAKEAIGIWKKYSLPDATKKIAEAREQLKTATTDDARAAAQKTLAAQEERLASVNAHLKAAEEEIAKSESVQGKDVQAKSVQASQAAQAALAQARANELAAAKVLLTAAGSFLSSDKLDAMLVKGAVLATATPHSLAEFAQQGKEQAALVDKLLADPALMKQMLEAGGAKFGKYGRAMEIYAAIQKASSKSGSGLFQRLALAVSLEHAMPIAQNNPQDQPNLPAVVDPVKRYQHYEKAYLDGELDPAFKYFTTWEYRMVVNCDASDQILAWGREMLCNYRPDHIYNPDYGWRYSATVTTEVPYGSQNVKDDLPSLQQYQNIIKDGGVCGRRAFFGRFILRSFGIPTWGVTQDAHAALSHWTPKGWLVNLGAGYPHSWWDKDEAPRSGADFLLETQARAHGQDYLKVLRAQWVSAVLGEQAYNDRRGVAGGCWSGMAHYQTVAMAATAVALGPLGQELAEANVAKDKVKLEQAKLTEADQKTVVSPDGVITIPAVAQSKPSGRYASMKSFSGGFQLHSLGGYKAEYEVNAPRAGKYTLAARVVTVQEGQKFLVAANDPKAPIEIAVPYTIGKWQQTKPVEISLVNGKNVLHFALQDGSRGVTIKEFTLTPVK